MRIVMIPEGASPVNRDAPDIIDQAIAWHLRQETMTAEDWPAFVAWLEGDAAHAGAYDAIAAQDRLIAQAAPPASMAANDDSPVDHRWWPIAGGGALAAALALWLVPPMLAPAPGDAIFATRNGERRDIRLADGTQVAMNGGTRLRVGVGAERHVVLDRGEVTVHVVHDAAHPFTLRVGDRSIEDVGTVFNVLRSARSTTVAVAEGSVRFHAADRVVRLAAGEALTETATRISRTPVAPAAVGGWRNGRLSFAGVPVSEVADSLRRSSGVAITLSPGLSDKAFTGMIHVTGAADRDVPHLADLIGATWRRDGERWVLAERENTTP